MIPGEWKWISYVDPVNPGGRGDSVIFIFDSVGQYTEVLIADMEMEIFTEQPEPRP